MVGQHHHLPVQRAGDVVNLEWLGVRGIIMTNQEETALFYVTVVAVIYGDQHFQLVLAVALLCDRTADGIQTAQAV